jgi:hypothetical protein
MAFDPYKVKLSDAKWTWREGKFCRFHKRPRNKDRVFGRNDKRSARQAEQREIDADRE